MCKQRITILRGGPGAENEVSLQTGHNILSNLNSNGHIFDVVIDRDGIWHLGGVATSLERVLNNTDIVFNALHGYYGEDGKIQKILDDWNVLYTGSRSFASAISMNKSLSKRFYSLESIKTPQHIIFRKDEDISERILGIFRSFPIPCIVKPVSGVSSLGISIVGNITQMHIAIENARNFSDDVLIEEFIQGREVSCGVIEDFRGKEFYPLMPIEVEKIRKICPTLSFTREEKSIIQEMAIKAHRALGLRHYSMSDFIVSRRRGVYLLETNSLPSMTRESLFSKSLEAVGCDFSYFLDHIIHLTVSDRKR